MRRRTRAILAMVGILLAIGAADLCWLLAPQQLERWLRGGLAQVFRTPVELGEISLSLRSGLRIRRLIVRGPDGEAAIAVDEAAVGIDWRRLRLGEVRIEWPVLDLRIDPRGKLNLVEALDPALLEGPSTLEPPPVSLTVNHAKVSFRDATSRAPEQVLSLDDIDIAVALDRDALTVRGAIVDPLWKEARFRATIDRRSGAIRAAVDVQKVKVVPTEAVRKRLPAPGWGVFDLLRPQATGDATIRFAKDPGAPPSVKVDIQVHEGGASVRVFPYSAQDCSGRVQVENDIVEGVSAIHVKIIGLHGAREGGTFGCDGDVWGMPVGSDDIIDLRIWAKEIPIDAKLGEALPPGPRRIYERFHPRGRASAKVHVYGRSKPKGEPDDIRIEVDGEAHEVRARFDGFPVEAVLAGTVSVRGNPSRDDVTFTMERLTGSAGGGALDVHGSASPTHGVDVHIVATRVKADEKLAEQMLPEHRSIVEMLALRGEANADIRVTGEPDAKGDVDPTFAARITAEPGLEAAFEDFPYPLVYRSGEVVVSPRGARIEDIQAAGRGSPLTLTVSGVVRADDVDGGGVDIRIAALDMPVDALLAKAAQVRAKNIWDALGPGGGSLRTLRIAAVVPQKGRPLELSVDAALDGVGLRPARSPLPVRGLTGLLHVSPTAIALERVEGRVGGAPVRAEGTIALEPGGTSTAVARIEGLELDDRVRAELPSSTAAVWTRIRPAGRLDAVVRFAGAGMELRPTVEAALTRGAFQLDFFPLAATELAGKVRAADGRAWIEGLAGKLGTGKLDVSGWIELEPDPAAPDAPPRSSLHASVRGLPLDARLIDAFPEAKRKTLAELGLGGALDLELDAGFDPRLEKGGVLSYAAEVEVGKGTLDVGLALNDLEGRIFAHGSWPIARVPVPELEGAFRIRRAHWKGQELTHASGRYALGERLFEVRELRADVLGGIAKGSFYSFSEPPRSFGASLSLAGGRLERWAEGRYSGKRKASGRVEGELTLAGTSGEPGSGGLAGVGELRIAEARLWELPLFAGLLNTLSFELPGKPVFDDAYVALKFEGKTLVVEQAEISSAAISFYGKGTLVDGNADLTFVPELGRPWLSSIPLVGEFWRFVKGNLVELEVKGPLDDPKVTPVPVKLVTDPARWLFGRRRRAGGGE